MATKIDTHATRAALAAALVLSGCAGAPPGVLMQDKPFEVSGSKPPMTTALCIKDYADGRPFNSMQPTITTLGDGEVEIVIRSPAMSVTYAVARIRGDGAGSALRLWYGSFASMAPEKAQEQMLAGCL